MRFHPLGIQQPPQVTAFQEHGLGQTGEFQQAPAHLALKLEPDQEQVSDQGGPDLNQHRILRGAIERFDFQVLLDPLEEKLDLPAATIELGNVQSR